MTSTARTFAGVVAMLGFVASGPHFSPSQSRLNTWGIHPGVHRSEVRRHLGLPDRSRPQSADWSYRRLGLDVDFKQVGLGDTVVARLDSASVSLDGQSFQAGQPAAPLLRLLGSPGETRNGVLRYRLDDLLLEISVDRRTDRLVHFALSQG